MIHLRGATSDVVVDAAHGVPVIVHWGAPLGDVDPTNTARALGRPHLPVGLDVPGPTSLVPEHGSGFQGRPGLTGHRHSGTAWAPRFAVEAVTPVEGGVEVVSVDPVAELRLVCTLTLGEVLRVRTRVANLGDTPYQLSGLHPTLPLPAHASELLTFDGRWIREFHPVRREWGSGSWLAEDRSGRTSHEHPPLVFAGTPGFGEWHGEVWGVHLAWSGNHSLLADCLPDGSRYLQAGELLHPGEVCLEPGADYETPDVVGVYSAEGLTAATWGFHRMCRSLPVHPERPRPVLLNTWEAVYFDHDTARLEALASTAAALGVERFVLDDGWFGGRRDDRRGLGDWWVSPDVYPHGLEPLIAHVRSLGMEFGIWVEPEMVNPDSDLFRAHPEWALVTPGYEPLTGRGQLVLDLARADAFAHVLEALDRLLADHDIAFVKWDMNRKHAQAGGAGGGAGSHAQTLAFYRLLDELRARHPGVEFESCASGGGRVDLGVLQRAERVWTSDCNDALERQTIQRGASMLIPPELMGAHIGPARSHTTGRMHSLAFRALTAMFGHLGVELDVMALDEAESEQLAAAISLHRRFRPLLHSGDVVRFDPVLNGQAPAGFAHGVYSADRREAIVAYVQTASGLSLLPPPLRLPGLSCDQGYLVEQVPLPGTWAHWEGNGLVLSGAQLAAHGIQVPHLNPESGILFHLTAV